MDIRPILLAWGLMPGTAAIRALAICVGLTATPAAIADPQAEFAAAFKAYQEAMEASAYFEAAGHAEKARRLGEEVYADDIKVRATLAFNHGYALAMAGLSNPAYRELKEARKLMRRAYGSDSPELLQVEMSLLNTVPDDAARRQLNRMLKLTARHYAEDSEIMAEVKLNGGMRVWWSPRAERLLGEAAETFGRLGRTEREARAKFWIGKIHLGHDRYPQVVESMTRVVELLPGDDTTALMARANLVEAYEKLGESDRATEHCLAIGQTVPWMGTANYQPLFKRAPTYPRSALARNAEGFVLLEFAVDEMGFVREPKVVESKLDKESSRVGQSGVVRALEDAAIKAAKRFRYAPKFVDGEPVVVERVRNRIVFQIRR